MKGTKRVYRPGKLLTIADNQQQQQNGFGVSTSAAASKSKNRRVFGELQEDPNTIANANKLNDEVAQKVVKPTIRVVKSNGLSTSKNDMTYSTRPSQAADKQSTADKPTSR